MMDEPASEAFLRGLFARVDDDLSELSREVGLLRDARQACAMDWQEYEHIHLQQIVLVGLASSIEKVYSGMEGILKILLQNLDGYIPNDEQLRQAARGSRNDAALPRPAILESDTYACMDAARAFRHRERNRYGAVLDKARVMEMSVQVLDAHQRLLVDISRFRENLLRPLAPEESTEMLPFSGTSETPAKLASSQD